MNSNLKLNLKRVALFPIYLLFFFIVLLVIVIQVISLLILHVMYAFKETYNDILNIYLFKILSLTIKTWWNNPQFSINSMREAREKRKLQEEKYNKFIIKDKSNE